MDGTGLGRGFAVEGFWTWLIGRASPAKRLSRQREDLHFQIGDIDVFDSRRTNWSWRAFFVDGTRRIIPDYPQERHAMFALGAYVMGPSWWRARPKQEDAPAPTFRSDEALSAGSYRRKHPEA